MPPPYTMIEHNNFFFFFSFVLSYTLRRHNILSPVRNITLYYNNNNITYTSILRTIVTFLSLAHFRPHGIITTHARIYEYGMLKIICYFIIIWFIVPLQSVPAILSATATTVLCNARKRIPRVVDSVRFYFGRLLE